MKHFKYLKYILRHKWYVFIECCKLGIPWRGFVHDLSKLKPSEWKPYADYFYGNYPSIKDIHGDMKNHISKYKEEAESDFKTAWLHHQNRNKHLWQYWLLVNDSSSKEFTLQEFCQGEEIYLSRNNRRLAMFDESILADEDKVVVNMCNSNAFLYAKEIQDRLNKSPVVLEMPDRYIKEMVADWRGAGKAIHGHDETEKWYQVNKDNMILNQETRARVEELLKN